MTPEAEAKISGRCYCGQISISARQLPSIVTYCHCVDCRRVTGAPVAALGAFDDTDLIISPDPGPPVSNASGVKRWFCGTCGSPLAAQYDYLPNQIYVPVGVLDQAPDLPPSLHCHTGSQLPWLCLSDELARQASSGRTVLLARKTKR